MVSRPDQQSSHYAQETLALSVRHAANTDRAPGGIGGMKTMIRTLLLLVALTVSTWAQPALTDQQIADATVLGRRCQAPMVHFAEREYDLYVESPLGHAALIVAAALMNHQPLDAPSVRNAMVPGYRIWAVRRFGVEPMPTITRITVKPRSGTELQATGERRDRLSMGTMPSHGIVDSLRTRLPQYEFSSLPPEDFDVLVHTEHGVRRYHVTSAKRTQLLQVCNERRP